MGHPVATVGRDASFFVRWILRSPSDLHDQRRHAWSVSPRRATFQLHPLIATLFRVAYMVVIGSNFRSSCSFLIELIVTRPSEIKALLSLQTSLPGRFGIQGGRGQRPSFAANFTILSNL